MLTAEILRSELKYDPETGKFTRSGHETGTQTSHGYIKIRIVGAQRYAHRLAWLYVYGKLPAGQIDHINGNRSDNRISNLRDVSVELNGQNRRKANPNNRSGYLGVCWDKQACKWKANITVKGRLKHLGFAPTPALAHALYLQAKRKLHEGNTL